jgi:MoaA/NifB/PqqE/SkfB family radical SAM enzyme
MHTDEKSGGLTLQEAPLRVYWEVTRACDLAYRAEAAPRRDPSELSAAEGRRLLDALGATTAPPRVVLTGGDPLKRSDLWALLEHGVEIGLGVSVAPSATPLLTVEGVRRLRRAGAEAMSLGLDGSDAVRHDGLRGVSHTGEVQPAGFLPITQGSVRTSDPLDVYRQSPLFQRLREPDRFTGRCGRCEYRQICGGSRSRAYADSGDPLGEDPLCVHEPGASDPLLREAYGCA